MGRRAATAGLIIALIPAMTLSERRIVPRIAVDLTGEWDLGRVLSNPHKGWFHHYYDNSRKVYPSPDEDLLAIPGLDHLYIRLPWSDFEPVEGEYDFHLIDDVVSIWVPRGYMVSIKVTCHETGQEFATPKWVMEAGAQGGYFENWGVRSWEPDYGDKVFLAKLGRFLKVLGKRYDGKPWLAYYDIGTYGNWGEGHTSFSSKRTPPVAVIKKHLDMNRKAFPKSLALAGDDWLKHGRSLAEEKELWDFAEKCRFAYRDDSVLVDFWIKHRAEDFSIDRPQYFRLAGKTRPNVLELEHYHLTKRAGNWRGQNGSERGAADLRGAFALASPTYVGYHGWAGEWMKENPALAKEMANRIGYWFFPRRAEFPAKVIAGKRTEVLLEWENLGYARAYRKYRMMLRLAGPGGTRDFTVSGADCRKWLPGERVLEVCPLRVPARLESGEYEIRVGLFGRYINETRAVEIGLKEGLRDRDGYYLIGKLNIIARR